MWLDLEHLIEEKSGKVVIFSPSTVILGTLEKDIGLNIIILLVKRYIYQTSRKRCNILFNDVRTYNSNYYNVKKNCINTFPLRKDGLYGKVFSIITHKIVSLDFAPMY